MAYDHQMQQHRMDAPPITGLGVAITGTPDLGVYAPALQPIVVRGVAFVVTTTCTVTPPVINFYRQLSPGVEAGRVLLKSITGLIGAFDAGEVVYAHIDSVAIPPGEAVQAEVGTSPTAGAGFAVIMFQPKWDSPLNNLKMTLSTT